MSRTATPKLSIIIPTLDEAAGIVALLRSLQPARQRGAELIVVDGGSADQTVALATPLVDRLVRSAAGRARQQNAGAAAARAPLLWFVHADTTLQGGEDVLLRAQSADWGRFNVRLSDADWQLALIAFFINLRSRMSGIATGDQAIFVNRELFAEVGGFPEQPLMEDVALSRLLRQRQPPCCLRHPIVTDSRRWRRHGVWRTVALMWWLRWRYFCGADPAILWRRYYADRAAQTGRKS